MNHPVYLFLDHTGLLIVPGTRNESPRVVQVTVQTKSVTPRVEDLAAYYPVQTEVLEIILRIVNHELLATTSQYFSNAASSLSNKDDYQEQSDQTLEKTPIAPPDVFVVEGASYNLVARKHPWVYGQKWNFFHGSYGNERAILAALSKWRFVFEPRTKDGKD